MYVRMRGAGHRCENGAVSLRRPRLRKGSFVFHIEVCAAGGEMEIRHVLSSRCPRRGSKRRELWKFWRSKGWKLRTVWTAMSPVHSRSNLLRSSSLRCATSASQRNPSRKTMSLLSLLACNMATFGHIGYCGSGQHFFLLIANGPQAHI